MADIPTNNQNMTEEAKENVFNPLTTVIDIVESFISRRRKINYLRITIIAINIIAAFLTIRWVVKWIQSHVDIVPIGAGLIALAGIFYGTVAYGLINPTLLSSEKIGDAKTIKKDMDKIAATPNLSDHVTFFEKLTAIFEKFYKNN